MYKSVGDTRYRGRSAEVYISRSLTLGTDAAQLVCISRSVTLGTEANQLECILVGQ